MTFNAWSVNKRSLNNPRLISPSVMVPISIISLTTNATLNSSVLITFRACFILDFVICSFQPLFIFSYSYHLLKVI